jgi:hypothetical protein
MYAQTSRPVRSPPYGAIASHVSLSRRDTYGQVANVADDVDEDEESDGRLYLDGGALSLDGLRAIPLVSVGRCATLVRADIHRQGVLFLPSTRSRESTGEAFVREVDELGGSVVGVSEVLVRRNME